jgi:riboflavin-specific deaminase-like protein
MENFKITIAYAQSINGCISEKWDKMYNFSNKESFKFTHSLRANHNLIMVGVGTIISNNPSLTTRHIKGLNPIPVIIDKNLSIPINSKVIKKNTIIVIDNLSNTQNNDKIDLLLNKGVRIIRLNVKNNHLVLKDLFEILSNEYNSILIEGGSKIISYMLSNCYELIENIIITIAPIFLNGDINLLTKDYPIDFKLKKVMIINILNDTTIIYNKFNDYNKIISYLEKYNIYFTNISN